MRDMAISLGVLVVPLVLLMAFCRPTAGDTPTVDPARTYQAAKASAKFPVRVPEELPSSWRATNSALRTGEAGTLTVRVTYLTPATKSMQLVQSDQAAEKLIVDELGAGRIEGAVTVGSARWQRYGGSRSGETALVLLEPKVTVVIVGDAGLEELRTLAGSLR
jgi:hypothetical protein